MDSQEQLRQKVNGLARNINKMRSDLVLAVRCEEYEQAAQLRDYSHRLQLELIELINSSTDSQVIVE